jgi:protein TonB
MWVITGGLLLVVSAFAFKAMGKKSPAPILPGGNTTVSEVISAPPENGASAPDKKAPESIPGEFEKKLPTSLPKPGPKETPGGAAKPPAAAVEPTALDPGADRGLPSGEMNPISMKPGELTPPPVGAPTKAEPGATKSANPDQIPGPGLQIRELTSVPIKPAETASPPVAAPVKESPPAVTAGQWVPLDQVDSQPQLLNTVNAIYPPLMMQRKIEGQLQFSILISENGDVLKADLISASTDHLGFESAARTALLKRKYKPALKGGVPVQVAIPINMVFKLNR